MNGSYGGQYIASVPIYCVFIEISILNHGLSGVTRFSALTSVFLVLYASLGTSEGFTC
jgi:hypothetical protein